MSELERERHKNAGLERARDSWYQEWFKGTERIAELQADVQREHDCVEHWSLRAETAEAALAVLKARNCLTCKHMPHTADEQCGQMVGWQMVSEEWGIRNRVLTACSEWERRP